MATIVISRVLGNELKPREIPGAKIKVLEKMLRIEADQKKPLDCFWVINRVYDKQLYAQYTNLLDKYNQKYEVLPWKIREYKRLKTQDQKIAYGTNVNVARNHGIRHCQKTHNFVIAADGDCYIPERFDMLSLIEADQCQRQYYSIPATRLHCTEQESDNPKLEEHIIILRNDADQLFDENIIFARGDNREIFERVGYQTTKGTCILKSEKSMVLQGHIIALSWSDDKVAEVDLSTRMDLRNKSIANLVGEMDKVQETVGFL